MCFTFQKNNKQTEKPVNCFLQDDASAGIQSLQTSIEVKLCQNPWNGLYLYGLHGKIDERKQLLVFWGLVTFSKLNAHRRTRQYLSWILNCNYKQYKTS